MQMRILLAALLLAAFATVITAHRQGPATAPVATRAITIVTEPSATVWVDDIRHGVTDAGGRLTLAKLAAGAHTLRVRANGFKETTAPINAAARGEIMVRLLRTTDQAELLFQQAETAREQGRNEEDRQKAAGLYRDTLKARAAFPAAHVGLARVLMDLNDTDGALSEITAARRYRPSYPEASAVEGRVYRETGQTDEAIGSFNRALRESRGVQPEAHVGLGRIYEEKGEYEMAAREFQIAINQLADTEPIIYQLLGAAHEKAGNTKDAIAAYENYLRLAPNGSLAPAVKSIVEQLKSEQPE